MAELGVGRQLEVPEVPQKLHMRDDLGERHEQVAVLELAVGELSPCDDSRLSG